MFIVVLTSLFPIILDTVTIVAPEASASDPAVCRARAAQA
jgi:hypothetical protein